VRNSLSLVVDKRLQSVLEPRRFIRWVYVGRLSIATAIQIAALSSWLVADQEKTLVATIAFFAAIFFTGASFVWTEVNRKPLTEGFLYVQLAVDLLIVTSVVHVTKGAESQFAALYILVNAAAALLLPIGGALLVALLGAVMYLADALTVSDAPLSTAVILQLVVFTLVALGTSYISAQLQAAGQGREALAAELVSVRLREKDILANIRSGILSVDDNGGLLFANASASELLGIDLEQRIGRPVVREIRLVAPVLADALDSAIRERVHAQRTEGMIEHEGRAFPLGVTTTSSDGDGGRVPRTTTAIFQDISDQKRLEQLNLRAQRLEAVAELSASLAHEIKNPLASIRSAVEQMSTRAAATADERTLGNLIVRESDRLSRLLSEFLDFARVRVTRRDAVDFAAVVRGAASLAASHPDRSDGATLDVRVADRPLIVHGDDDLLHRAVFNLALNALQATRPGTTVTIIADLATREQLPRGVPFPLGAIALQVTDEGAGIPAEVQDRLFEPFTTTKPGGTGLGLAITHRAIEAHRGVVLVDTDSRGTRFTVLLPLTEATEGVTE
jgi:two-component system sensor histidine kinase PilS (NtrC family)